MGGRGTVPPLPTPAGSLAQNHPDQQISELYAAIVNKAGLFVSRKRMQYIRIFFDGMTGAERFDVLWPVFVAVWILFIVFPFYDENMAFGDLSWRHLRADWRLSPNEVTPEFDPLIVGLPG